MKQSSLLLLHALLAATLCASPSFAEDMPIAADVEPSISATPEPTYDGPSPHIITKSFALRLGESAMIPVMLNDDAPTLITSDLRCRLSWVKLF